MTIRAVTPCPCGQRRADACGVFNVNVVCPPAAALNAWADTGRRLRADTIPLTNTEGDPKP